MNPVNNPYTPGAGTPPPDLAGREDVLKQAENAILRTLNLKTSRSQILLGLRGVGKTVLLNKINQIAEESGGQTAIIEATSSQTLPEMITSQLYRLLLKLNRAKKAGNDLKKGFILLSEFASLFKVRVGEIEFGMNPTRLTGDLSMDLGDLLFAIGEAAKTRRTVVVILIDEVQYLVERDLEALILALHRISQKEVPLLFFGAGLPQLAKLAGEAKSYAERLFNYIVIDRLDDKSARKALEKPAREEKVEFEPMALQKIIEETEGYPYFIQLWGSYAWDIAKASPVTLEDVKRATDTAILSLDSGFFRIRYDRLTERQKEYVRAMAEVGHLPLTSTEVAQKMNMSVQQAAPLRDEVIKKGVAYSPERGMVTFSVPKFEEFIKRLTH